MTASRDNHFIYPFIQYGAYNLTFKSRVELMLLAIKLPTTFTVSMLLLSTAMAGEPIKFDYKNNGLDWVDRWSECGRGT